VLVDVVLGTVVDVVLVVLVEDVVLVVDDVVTEVGTVIVVELVVVVQLGLFEQSLSPQSAFPSQSLSCPSEQAVSAGGVVAHV
jgi:hypothetical protein